MIRKLYQSRWAPALAFLLVVLAVGYAVQVGDDKAADRLYESQIAGCMRGNTLRKESNNRTQAHRADTEGLIEFLAAARKARMDAFETSHHRNDLLAAHRYKVISRRVLRNVKFKIVPLVNCQTVIARP